MDLFSSDNPIQHIKVHDDGHLWLIENFLDAPLAEKIFSLLLESLHWRQDYIQIQGKRLPIPRLEAWYGNPEAHYSYSGISLSPEPFTPELRTIMSHIQDTFSTIKGLHVPKTFLNSVLCNLYRDGNDSVSWHSDDEPELGPNPVIASVSLGDSREFQLRHNKSRETLKITLEHNSLLVMGGRLQHFWQHQIPKTKKVTKPRVNLTFRHIYEM